MIVLVAAILSSLYSLSVHGRFTKFPELKNGRWKTISIQPDFRQYMEDKPNNFQYMEHAETSTILSRHKRQMPTYSKQLHHVGLFIAAHKYFGIDGRKMSDKSRIFYKSFPVPPLKKMDSKLDGPCRESAVKCILAIHKVILSPGTSSLYPLLHHTVPPLNWPGFYPFKSWATMFEFRATASYFMCWYTMKRDEIMAHFMKGKNCLLYLNRLQESRKSGITVFDWRTDDHNKPFSCAEIMFCPNPCYGRRTGGSIPSAKFMLHDVGNPCREFKDNTCRLIPKNNMDLMGMVQNHLNYTCRCSKGKAGVYNARTGFCQKETKKENGQPTGVRKNTPIQQNNNNSFLPSTANIIIFLLINIFCIIKRIY